MPNILKIHFLPELDLPLKKGRQDGKKEKEGRKGRERGGEREREGGRDGEREEGRKERRNSFKGEIYWDR